MTAEDVQPALMATWPAIAEALGADRERVEYELISLLRDLDLAETRVERQRLVEAILRLLEPFAAAHDILVRSVANLGRTLKKGAAPAGARPGDRFTTVPVFFGTDRAVAAPAGAILDFSGGRGELAYGIAQVSVPDDPRMRRIGRPRWWRLEFREDPSRQLVIQAVDVCSEADFVSRARATLRGAKKNEVLVFIHGFANTFRDALMRAAQVAYDLHFEGLATLFSWPSEGAATAPGYLVDEGNIELSRSRFARFLKTLREELGAETVHLVAHSMGNRLLVETLLAMAATPALGVARLNQVVFAAPDIDAATFRDRASSFALKASRFTLYASSLDLALQVSKRARKYPRAGDSGPDVVLAESVDTVDVSAVDTSFIGHAYYAENRSVISDLIRLIREGTPPEARDLQPLDRAGARYWTFRPNAHA